MIPTAGCRSGQGLPAARRQPGRAASLHGHRREASFLLSDNEDGLLSRNDRQSIGVRNTQKVGMYHPIQFGIGVTACYARGCQCSKSDECRKQACSLDELPPPPPLSTSILTILQGALSRWQMASLPSDDTIQAVTLETFAMLIFMLAVLTSASQQRTRQSVSAQLERLQQESLVHGGHGASQGGIAQAQQCKRRRRQKAVRDGACEPAVAFVPSGSGSRSILRCQLAHSRQ